MLHKYVPLLLLGLSKEVLHHLFLRYLIDKFSNVNTAIVAYNAGESNVKKWLNDIRYSLDGITLLEIPFHESKEYLRKTLKTFEEYEKLYCDILDK